MSGKIKGSKGERELIRLFNESGWGAVRAAGSGSSTYPSPDILVGNGSSSFALECKTFKREHKYLENHEISQLIEFSQKFGAQPIIAIKFDYQPWYFLKIADLNKTGKAWRVSLPLARQKGLSLKEFLSQQPPQNQKV